LQNFKNLKTLKIRLKHNFYYGLQHRMFTSYALNSPHKSLST
jgi:hypothetical protein